MSTEERPATWETTLAEQLESQPFLKTTLTLLLNNLRELAEQSLLPRQPFDRLEGLADLERYEQRMTRLGIPIFKENDGQWEQAMVRVLDAVAKTRTDAREGDTHGENTHS